MHEPARTTVPFAAGPAAARVRGLPGPASPLPGGLEQVAWLLLHRAAPFDPVAQAQIADRWGLAVPGVLQARASTALGSGPRRAPGALRRVAALASGCPPPPLLRRALHLGGQAPGLSRDGLGRALLTAGLSQGQAGAPLLRALALMWQLEADSAWLWPDRDRQEELEVLARQVRVLGAGPVPEPSAAERDWLAGRGLSWCNGHLALADDRRSSLGLAVRAQLAALGPQGALVLAQGVARARPRLRQTTPGAVLAWACLQPRLHVQRMGAAAVVFPTGNTDGWLSPADRAVLALGGGELSRGQVVAALTARGWTPGAAAVWLARCAWLRQTGARGHYARPPAR